MNILRRVSKKESKFLGVCGGISKYIDPELDPVIIRALWALFTLIGLPVMVLSYFGLAVFLKRDDEIIKEDV